MAISSNPRMTPMKLLRIKDNSLIEKGFLHEINNLTKNIADKTLLDLEGKGIFVFPEGVGAGNDLVASVHGVQRLLPPRAVLVVLVHTLQQRVGTNVINGLL